MRVRAISQGYYQHRRRYKGDVFTLTPYTKRDGTVVDAEKQFSKVWMEKVDKATPEVNQPKIPIDRGHLDAHQEQREVGHPGVLATPEKPKEPKPKVPAGIGAEAKPEEPKTEEKPKKSSSGDSDVI